jgi:hypothetical protein
VRVAQPILAVLLRPTLKQQSTTQSDHLITNAALWHSAILPVAKHSCLCSYAVVAQPILAVLLRPTLKQQSTTQSDHLITNAALWHSAILPVAKHSCLCSYAVVAQPILAVLLRPTLKQQSTIPIGPPIVVSNTTSKPRISPQAPAINSRHYPKRVIPSAVAGFFPAVRAVRTAGHAARNLLFLSFASAFRLHLWAKGFAFSARASECYPTVRKII